MAIPGFSADHALGPAIARYRGVNGAPAPVAIIAPQAGLRGRWPISMKDCWQACINGIGECPPECADVPWPTFPPPPPKFVY